MQIYEALKKQRSLVTVLSKTGACSVTGRIPGEYVQMGIKCIKQKLN